jgi:FkbM family methyltransferase
MDLYNHTTPFFTQWVVEKGFLQEPFVVVDIGVQGGPHPRWQHLGDNVKIYGFDPISEVIETLEKARGPNEVYRNVALGNEDGTRAFNVASDTYGSSFFGSNSDSGVNRGITLGQRMVEIRRLDSIFAANEIECADYVKLDCEGFEPEVIRGSREYLARSNVLCVTTETSFGVSPLFMRTPFVEICEMLTEHRLLVFDLNAVRTARPSYLEARAREPWPENDIMDELPRLDVGQPRTFDFVFCRDFVQEAMSPHHFTTLPNASVEPTVDKLIKTMINFELHGLMDCAVEIATHFRETLSPRFDIDEAVSLLVRRPPHSRNTADVADSLRIIDLLRERGYQTQDERNRLIAGTKIDDLPIERIVNHLVERFKKKATA